MFMQSMNPFEKNYTGPVSVSLKKLLIYVFGHIYLQLNLKFPHEEEFEIFMTNKGWDKNKFYADYAYLQNFGDYI